MGSERYELISSIIKKFNSKTKEYEKAKDANNLAFIKKMRIDFLDLIMHEREIYVAKTILKNNTNNEIYEYRLVSEEILFDDNGNTVFIEIDLETGEIGLLNDGGFAAQSKKINGKSVKSDFEIESQMSILDAIKKYFSSLDNSQEKIDFRILKYIRNNFNKYDGDIRAR